MKSLYHWFDKDIKGCSILSENSKLSEFHAFSKIAPGIEHLAFSTGKIRNTKTSTSLGQEVSQAGSLT